MTTYDEETKTNRKLLKKHRRNKCRETVGKIRLNRTRSHDKDISVASLREEN
jgi:hypothetical protein